MATERTPAPEKLPDSGDFIRELRGTGFEKLADSLASDKPGMLKALREKRPLYIVTDYADQPRDTKEFVKGMLVERLGLQPDESDLIHSNHLDEFDDQVVQQIIDDRRRPIILPIVIGSGSEPVWWIGPEWMFYSKGNVGAFRSQFAFVASDLRAPGQFDGHTLSQI